MIDRRPDVPSDVRRRLRQEAGFGCCFCGHPFIQYHHIIPWKEDQHFRPEDMMTVCGQCHPLCTVGAIPPEDQRRHKAKPKNVVDKELRGKLYVNADELIVKIGSATARETPNLLVLAGNTVVGARLSKTSGRVLLTAHIHGKNGNTVARLVDNEWSLETQSIWDFEATPCHALIRQGLGDISFAVDCRDKFVEIQGKWFHRGMTLSFNPKRVMLDSAQLLAVNAAYCNTMFNIS